MARRKQIQKALEELEIIKADLVENIFPSIKQTKSDLDAYRLELLIDSDDRESVKTRISNLDDSINALKIEADSKISDILEYHKDIFEGDDEGISMKETLVGYLDSSKKLIENTEIKKKDFDIFYEKVFGKKDENGETVGGLEKEITKYDTRYKTLFDKIESLLPGATTAGLAKVFSDKVDEYKKTVSVWTWTSFVLLLALTFYYICVPVKAQNMMEVLIGLLNRLPFIIFAVWLVIFAGNRRAESKKLEESYKHKEVMARSFVGYKEQIEELEESDTDKLLLKTHMSNLLLAINENSGHFLDKEGDNSPVHQIINSVKPVLNKRVKVDSSGVEIKNEE